MDILIKKIGDNRRVLYDQVSIINDRCNYLRKIKSVREAGYEHNIPFSATDTKKVFYEKIKQKKTPVVYKTDKIANLHRHEVLRTPVRH